MSHHAVIARPQGDSWHGVMCGAGEIADAGPALWRIVTRDGLERARAVLFTEQPGWYILDPEHPDIEGAAAGVEHTEPCPFCQAPGGVPHHYACDAQLIREWRRVNLVRQPDGTVTSEPSSELRPHFVAGYGLALSNPQEWLDPDEARYSWILEAFILEDGGLRLLEHDLGGDEQTWVEMAFYSWTDPEPDWPIEIERIHAHWRAVLGDDAEPS
jgi:hypothetical protein